MKKVLIYCLLAALIIASTTIAFAGSGSDNLVKEFEYKTKKGEDVKKKVPKEIEVKNKKYELKKIEDVRYKPNISVKKRQEVSDKGAYPKTIEYKTKEGKIVTLKADEKSIKWEESNREPKVVHETYRNRNDIPNVISITAKVNNENIEAEASCTDIKEVTKTENFSMPATFYGVYGSPYYSYNGKTVRVDEGSPTWSGYKADISRNLNLAGGSDIKSAGWSTNEINRGEGTFTRHAVYTGTRPMTAYNATFTETDKTTKIYTADITYEDTDSGILKAGVKALYSPAGFLSLGAIIGIGAGILALALLTVAVLYVLSKKRKNTEAANQN